MKAERGLGKVSNTGHTVICGYNDSVDRILAELFSVEEGIEIVLINRLDEDELEDILYRYRDKNLNVIKGDFTSESVIDRANIKKAKSIIIIPDYSGGEKPTGDERTIVGAYAIRAVNKKAKLFAHILSSESASHLKKAGADDFVISDSHVGFMLGRMTTDPGVSQSLSTLFDIDGAQQMKRVAVKDELVGKTFADAYSVYRKDGFLPVGIIHEDEKVSLKAMLDDDSYLDSFIEMKFRLAGKDIGESLRTEAVLNPPDDTVLARGSFLLVIGGRK